MVPPLPPLPSLPSLPSPPLISLPSPPLPSLPSLPSLPLVTQQIHCPFQPKQSPSLRSCFLSFVTHVTPTARGRFYLVTVPCFKLMRIRPIRLCNPNSSRLSSFHLSNTTFLRCRLYNVTYIFVTFARVAFRAYPVGEKV